MADEMQHMPWLSQQPFMHCIPRRLRNPLQFDAPISERLPQGLCRRSRSASTSSLGSPRGDDTRPKIRSGLDTSNGSGMKGPARAVPKAPRGTGKSHFPDQTWLPTAAPRVRVRSTATPAATPEHVPGLPPGLPGRRCVPGPENSASNRSRPSCRTGCSAVGTIRRIRTEDDSTACSTCSRRRRRLSTSRLNVPVGSPPATECTTRTAYSPRRCSRADLDLDIAVHSTQSPKRQMVAQAAPTTSRIL